jgi:uncharacterized protein with GYD domain
MSLYLFRFAYSTDAWAALMEHPQDRREFLAARVFADYGGRFVALWYAFGEYDGYAVVELPDAVTAAAYSVAVTASGSFRRFETTPLLTADEMLEALQHANDLQYQKPGSA